MSPGFPTQPGNLPAFQSPEQRFGDPVTVKHESGEYPVYIASASLSQLDALVRRHLSSRRLIMVADQVVWDLAQSGRWGPLAGATRC